MKVAIFGASGQLGRDVVSALAGHDVVAVDHGRADVRRAEAVDRVMQDERPDWAVNCAAMTNVDACENAARDAFEINALGARHVAVSAAKTGARVIHVSTDYVFDGEKTGAYVESDPTRPINAYGISKLAGELFVRAECPGAAVVRTSGLYGTHPCRGKGTNFVETILARAAAGGPLRVVRDERLTPTYTADLAREIHAMIEADVPAGVYHAVNPDGCSWYEFAVEAVRLAGLDVKIEPIAAAEWKSPARRPANSVLENRALAALGLDRMPGWRDALGRYMAARSAGIRTTGGE